MTGRPRVTVTVTPELASLVDTVKRAHEGVHQATRMREDAAATRRVGLQELRDHGLTSRQIGELVGMTTAAVEQALYRHRGKQST